MVSRAFGGEQDSDNRRRPAGTGSPWLTPGSPVRRMEPCRRFPADPSPRKRGQPPGRASRPWRLPGKVIDAHAHLIHHSRPDWADGGRRLIDAADRLGIDQLCWPMLSPRRPATPDDFRQCNNRAAEAMRRFPGRVLRYAFVNPGYAREARGGIRRCVEDLGFIGVKLYNDYVATEPVVRPVAEQAIGLRIPILHHAGHPYWLGSPQPRISDGGTFAELARRYPKAMLICAHVCGGGDWEWTIKGPVPPAFGLPRYRRQCSRRRRHRNGGAHPGR